MLNTLRSLRDDEMFFFLEEWGPTQVWKRGGMAYRRTTQRFLATKFLGADSLPISDNVSLPRVHWKRDGTETLRCK